MITLASALPAVTGASTRLDATTQTVNIGNTNSGAALGTGGSVGVDNVAFPQFPRPEVQLNCAASATALTLSGSSQTIIGFALNQGYILLSGPFGTARNNLVGMTATGSSADDSSACLRHRLLGERRDDSQQLRHGQQLRDPQRRRRHGLDGHAQRSGAPVFGPHNTFDGILLIVNYGGGAGRPLGTAGTLRIEGARVEVYNSANALQQVLTTDANGFFTYTYSGNAQRRIRVVNGSVRSDRTGGSSCTTCVPVQTYRVEAPTGANVAVPNEVGGRSPALSDAAAQAATFPATTATQTAQSWSAVDPDNSGDTVAGIDFGFNFDTIVNTRDASSCTPTGTNNTFFPCQGALRQFIINANALGGEGSLDAGRQRPDRRRPHDAALRLRIQHLHDPERRAD